MNNINLDDEIKNLIPDLLNDFSVFIPKDSKTKIINYSGIAGLEKVTRNSLNAKGELTIVEIETMGAFLNFGFCEDVRKGMVKNNIHVKELTNQKSQVPWTNIDEFVDKFWQCKYVDKNLLEIKSEILVYNDVVAMYNYKNNDVFCVEIYNQNLADMQKQIFNFIWKYAQDLKVGKGGAAEL